MNTRLASLLATFALTFDATAALAQCVGGMPNGALDPTEECDDANTTLGDGCDAMCRVEPGWLCSQPVDFDNLSSLQYVGGNANWVFSADGWTGRQTVNSARPTFAVFGADATAVTYVFDIQTGPTTDDDFVGFVFGFQPSDVLDPAAEYILLDWKRANQGCSGNPNVGMALSRVHGIPNATHGTGLSDNFWCHTGNTTNGVLEFARATTYASTGWVINRRYRFEITYSLSRIIVRVTDTSNGTTVTAFDVMGTFPPGQIGFYGYSQDNVSYTIISPRGPSLCNRPPVVPDITTTVRHTTGGRCFDVIAGATDPDGDLIDPASVAIVSAAAGVTTTDPSTGAPPGRICLVPDDLTTTDTFVTRARVCDDRPVPRGCSEMTLTVTFQTACDGLAAGADCTDLDGDAGTCRGAGGPLACCTGCWDGAACAGGGTLTSCGAAGALCASCVDGNDCTTDACSSGSCVNAAVPLATPCADGVCTGATAMCVQCVSSAQCGGATPHCDTTSNICVGCLSDANCTGGTPLCDPDAQVCVQCVSAAQCADGNVCTLDVCTAGSCGNPPAAVGTMCSDGVCDGASSCVTCVGDAQCSGATPYCVANGCVGCRDAADCDDENECTANACGAGACMTTPLAAGTSCSLGVCTPAAVCAMVAVQIITPDDGSRVGTATPTITGTATPGTTVTVAIDGEDIGTVVANADGTWSITPATALPDGERMVTATVTTSNGTAMDASTFVVDTETEVAITSPADGATTLDSTPNVRGTGEPGATVVVTIDGEEVGTATVGGDGTWVVPVTTPLANGEYTAEATATDSVGNTASATSTFTVDANTDVDIISPANGSATNDTTPTITGTAVPGATVVVTIEVGGETREVGTVTADAEGYWLIEVTDELPEGTHTVTATATDPAGNVGADESTFTVDTSTTIAITDVDPSGSIRGTGEPGATVVVTINGVEVGTTTVGEDGTWTLDVDPLGPGTYEITATGTDRAGNTASDTTSITVEMGDGGVVRPDAGVDGGARDGGVGGDAGVLEGGYSGGALCATSAGRGAGDPLALFALSLVGLALWRRRRR